MAKSKKDYFDFGRVASLIFAIIPITSWIFGIFTRFQEGKLIAGTIRIFFGFNIIWILDIIFMVVEKKICRILNI